MFRIPGKTFQGTVPQLTGEEISLREKLESHVKKLASEIGERNIYTHKSLHAASQFITDYFTQSGLRVRQLPYEVTGQTCLNLEGEVTGINRPDEIIIIGAHYDTVPGSPGANDNASGVAGILELAHDFIKKKVNRTLRFVAFVNEEPPFFKTSLMGSLIYAQKCKQRGDRVVGMLSLETMGYYSDSKGSQLYPFPLGLFYPSTGNFIGFVSNLKSGSLLRRVIKTFREQADFPSEGAVVPAWIPGVDWSDHWSFWQQDYPALMVTDTALYRYPYYHTPEDVPSQIDFDRLTRVIVGLKKVVEDLVKP
jgi:Zn-dependent M28 family amino/carboxypeptidase